MKKNVIILVNYWMFIINEQNWKIVIKENIIGSKNKNKIISIEKNDIVVIYVKSPLAAITGFFKVINNYNDNTRIFTGELYPYRLKLNPIKILKDPISIKSIINELSFIKNKTKWFTHFFGVKGVRKLSQNDYKVIFKKIVV